MVQGDCRGISPEQERAIIIAAEQTCELCHEYFPVSSLLVHQVTSRIPRGTGRDPSLSLLVVCGPCHNHIHALPVTRAKQRALARKRTFFIRRDIRRILGYVPKPCSPPDTVELSQVYEEYMGRCSPGSYRLGG